MNNQTVTQRTKKYYSSKKVSEKYEVEYNEIVNKLALMERKELFPQLVRLKKICDKADFKFPNSYIQYYNAKKIYLQDQLRVIERRILMSQINNENYSHLEKKATAIKSILGNVI